MRSTHLAPDEHEGAADECCEGQAEQQAAVSFHFDAQDDEVAQDCTSHDAHGQDGPHGSSPAILINRPTVLKM